MIASRLNAVTDSRNTALCLHFPALWNRRVCPSEGSNVGCSHAATCPLFPLLRASLQGWRDHYCNSADRWNDCARYQLSLTGERVPISLLPNGARAQHIERAADANRLGAASPSQAPRRTPPSRLDPWQPEPTAQFEPAPPPAPLLQHQPSSPTQLPRPPERRVQRTRRARGAKQGWWARIADWMRGPA